MLIFCLTLTLGCLISITSKPAGNQQNQQHSYENFGASDDYERLDLENIRTSTYETLQLNNKDMKYNNETFALNPLKNDNENNKCAKDHAVEGIIIVLLHLISWQVISGHKIVRLYNQTSRTKGSYKIKKVGGISILFLNSQLIDI